MTELLISDYDSSCTFNACIIQDNEVKEVFKYPFELGKYNLYDEELNMFDSNKLNAQNLKLLQFDRIIYCYNGEILILGTIKRTVKEVRFE